MASEDGELFKKMREEQQKRRKERLPERTNEILSLKDSGYTVVKITDYQYRINGLVDIYPIHRRYHILKTNKRGEYRCNHLLFFLNGIMPPSQA